MVSSSSIVEFESDEVIDRFLVSVDVWQTIFEMLEVEDRIRLEMTNKRLHMLMLEYWKRVTSFDTEGVTEMSDNLSMNEKRWAAFVSICVNRIGDGLRSLTIRERSIYPVRSWSADLPSIGEGCPNVETINVLFEEQYRTLDNIRFDSFSRLKTITVCTEETYFIEASASVFLSIPASIEVIRGLCGKRLECFENGAQMEGFFAHRPSLREVRLDWLYTGDDSKADIFRVIAQRCPQLKSIKLPYSFDNCIDYSGVVALDEMKELRIIAAVLIAMEIVTICERSPLVEVLQFRCLFSNLDQQSTALNALGSLTKLRGVQLEIHSADEVAPSLATDFVRELARNSGASLRRLCLNSNVPLPTAAVEALANGCPKLRHVKFWVHVGEATPASIGFLIDSIVAHPSWIIHQTGEPTLQISIGVMPFDGDEAEAGRATFRALADPAANLPAGIRLRIF